MENKWLEMILTADKHLLPHLTELLLSTKIKTWAEEQEGDKVRLKVYVPYFEGIEKYKESLGKLLDFEKVEVVTRELPDEDWSTSWQKLFEVIHIGERIVIKPPWKEYEAKEGEIIIEIEPRMAFGSGYHPTTAGTLVLMEKYIKPGMKVLDMGCGSGILSIAASHLGASYIYGVDIDEICIREAPENFKKARIAYPHLNTEFKAEISDGFEKVKEEYDAVLVNVLTEFILSNPDNIVKHTIPGGYFITGSIGDGKVDLVTGEMEKRGMKRLELIEREGWHGAVFQKPSSKKKSLPSVL